MTTHGGDTAVVERARDERRRHARALLLRAGARTVAIVFGSFVLYRLLLALARGALTVQLAGRGSAHAVTITDPLGLMLLALAFAPVALLPIAVGVQPRLLRHPQATRVMLVSIAVLLFAAVFLQVAS